MSDLKDLYVILERMERNAEKDNVERVLELNKQFESVCHEVYSDPNTDLDVEYERCRQSCVLSFTGFMSFMHDELVNDAKESFYNLPNPYYG